VETAELAAIESRWQAAQGEFAQQVHAPSVAVIHSGHLIASQRPEAVVAAVRAVRAAQAVAAVAEPALTGR
jgi:hypothetical protein